MKLTECCNAGLQPTVVTSEPVVRDCKILGLESRRKNRRYLAEAMERAAHLYENVEVYIDHDESSQYRSFLSKFGRFKNVRFKEGQGLFGDFHYNPKHLYAGTFQGWLEFDPENIGFSHAADGDTRRTVEGVEEVYAITSVDSVDLVAKPSTTKGLYESMDPLEMTMPAPEPTPEPGTDGYEAAIGKLVNAIMVDQTLDKEAKKKKLLVALKLLDEEVESSPLSEEAPVDAPENEDTEEKDVEEAVARITSKLLEAVDKAVASKLAESKVKQPVSIPAKGKGLTMDDFLEGFGNGK